MKVVVIGAGIGGLAVAAGLQRQDIDVTVLERAERFAAAGSGLSLFGNGFRALDALGLGPAVRQISATEPFAGRAGIRVASGRWISTTSEAATHDLRVVDRTALHGVLLGALGPGSVQHGSSVRSVHEDEVRLTDGRRVSGADVVVGADGIRSTVRAGWPHSPPIRYSGYVAWRAITRRPFHLDVVGETWGRGRRFGFAPLPDGRVYWFATANRAPDAPATDGMGALTDLFGTWHHPIPDLLDATDSSSVQQLPIEELAHAPATFVRGRTALLGDAAHAMTPNLGQGANQALEDAATLSALLGRVAGATTPADAVAAALQRYDIVRTGRTAGIALQARRIGAVGQWSNPAATAIRDRAVRLTPDRRINALATEIQNWHPPASAGGVDDLEERNPKE
ncbi:MAG: FAD-dependent monooxygenase [Nocardioides sp.]